MVSVSADTMVALLRRDRRVAGCVLESCKRLAETIEQKILDPLAGVAVKQEPASQKRQKLAVDAKLPAYLPDMFLYEQTTPGKFVRVERPLSEFDASTVHKTLQSCYALFSPQDAKTKRAFVGISRMLKDQVHKGTAVALVLAHFEAHKQPTDCVVKTFMLQPV